MNELSTTSTFTQMENDSAEALQSRIQGEVICPDDAQYDEARLAWNRSIDQHPALIVIAASPADVAEAVRFARRQGLGIAIQSGGHGVTLPADGALLLVTNRLKALRVDPQSRTAWIGAGLKWGDVLAEAQKFGLAPLLGSSPDVGVVGYTLGGGMGWLARKYGLATDSVLSFDVVNVEGQLLRASRVENGELFWGLRGGGGSFGIITGMEIRLYPVEMVYGGNLYYPAEMAKEVMQRYRTWIRSAPDELTTSIVLMNFPPFPEVPEMFRGKSFVIVRGCYIGPLEEGEARMSYWRDWKQPAIDHFQPMPFSQAARISNDPEDPSPFGGTGTWMRELSDEAIDTLIRYTLPHGGPPALVFVEIRHAGGAIARVEPGSAAFTNRDSELALFALGPTPTPEAEEAFHRYTAQLRADLQPWLTGGVYMNFVHGPEAHQRTREGYTPEAFRRLQALKAGMDPENVLRYSFDIAPKA